MHRGYLKLFRKIEDNEFWQESRVFSKAEAWIDILLHAQHQKTPKKVVLGTKVFIQNRGECLKSLSTWAKRWNWTKSRVSRVLHMFQECNMIGIKNETKTIRITVLNYAYYAEWRNDNGTEVKRNCNDIETEVEPKKNVKNDKDNGYKESFDLIHLEWKREKLLPVESLSDLIKTNIMGALQAYSLVDLIESIQNYSKILHSTDYFFTYHYELLKFFQQNYMEFLTKNNPYKKYEDQHKKKPRGRQRKKLASDDLTERIMQPDRKIG